ncbi:uncharacterized protein YbcC (UPF0753/DUF2309 family) [Pseudomonas sp. BP8]|nr:uncharacterized protein YbcC (UPF0753/DUF2309 family) [Pseudomonas sp. BP8]
MAGLSTWAYLRAWAFSLRGIHEQLLMSHLAMRILMISLRR